MTKNHLNNETSPYLQQHADNPVDWYPWNEEALKKAKKFNKPILLSIGYSACHWCHVMAHESFEDQETAALMNQHFINIKVDREERPDLDKIYQTALQLLIQKPGGWPLTMFLTPNNHIPFFGGTYFPKQVGFNGTSFKEVLLSVSDYFKNHQQEIQNFTTKFQNALQLLNEKPLNKGQQLNNKPLQLAQINLGSEYDPINGGFGSAPKFPLTNQLVYLLDYWYRHKKNNTETLKIVTHSLEKMALRGLHDHVGGGFFRYCVDEAWTIPHFEKMLYDNAQLLSLYTDAAIATDNVLFKESAITIGEWVIDEMQSDKGGYYSTINADSEGEEGKFYVWDKKEIQFILDKDEYNLIERYFALDSPANFENHWHLNISLELDIDTKKSQQRLQEAIYKLKKIRNQRIHPDRDEKILTSWNALMIKGMLTAGIYLNHSDFIKSAERALAYIFKNLWKNQHLFASTKDGKTTLMAYLDDYAFLLDAMLQYLQIKWSDYYFQLTLELAKNLCQHFHDESQGGFYFTANNHETLIQRPKPIIDDATPAGNGIAAQVLLRLGYVLGDQYYLDIAEQTLQMARDKIEKFPSGCTSLLMGLEEYLTPPIIIILRGNESELIQWQTIFFQHYLPHHLCFAILDDTAELPEALQKPLPKTGIAAYLCQGHQCFKTLVSLDDFKQYLKNITS